MSEITRDTTFDRQTQPSPMQITAPCIKKREKNIFPIMKGLDGGATTTKRQPAGVEVAQWKERAVEVRMAEG